MYPDLPFKHLYGKGGMDFSGYVIFKAGVEIEKKVGDFDEYFPT